MNERIRELEKQSYFTFKDENSLESLVFSKEKFAQLIVQDCISQIALIGISNFENDDISWAVDFAIKKIQEKFGVK
jgi:hypothetical protein